LPFPLSALPLSFRGGGYLDAATTDHEHDHVSRITGLSLIFLPLLFLFKGETRARLFAFCPLQLLSIILVFNAPESTQGLIFYWLHNPVFFSAAKSHKLRRVDSREKNAMKIQASFVKDGKWWVAWTDDVPGALTQERL
jgi:hypothetical protein